MSQQYKLSFGTVHKLHKIWNYGSTTLLLNAIKSFSCFDVFQAKEGKEEERRPLDTEKVKAKVHQVNYQILLLFKGIV